MDKQLAKMREEKADEIEKRNQMKDKYDKIIKEIEDQIKMLRSESGD